jgi:hypothetical protein
VCRFDHVGAHFANSSPPLKCGFEISRTTFWIIVVLLLDDLALRSNHEAVCHAYPARRSGDFDISTSRNDRQIVIEIVFEDLGSSEDGPS